MIKMMPCDAKNEMCPICPHNEECPVWDGVEDIEEEELCKMGCYKQVVPNFGSGIDEPIYRFEGWEDCSICTCKSRCVRRAVPCAMLNNDPAHKPFCCGSCYKYTPYIDKELRKDLSKKNKFQDKVLELRKLIKEFLSIERICRNHRCYASNEVFEAICDDFYFTAQREKKLIEKIIKLKEENYGGLNDIQKGI